MCDELAELDWVVALTKLLEILNGVAEKANKRIAMFIKCQLSQWIAALPYYIKVYLRKLSNYELPYNTKFFLAFLKKHPTV
jgi:hypothetical protein